MLKYNINRLFPIIGISKPIPFLVSLGIPRNTASKIVNNKAAVIYLKYVEKLCVKFKCSPNDLMEWVPDNQAQLKENPQLVKLMGNSSPVFDFQGMSSGIPFEKLPLFADKINALKKEILSGNN